jgi:sec-independent protein translocase protein TatB
MGTPPPIEVANLGMADSLILMVMALVVFGPRRLPQIGRQIGKLMYEFRKASNDFKFQMEEELRSSEEADRRKKEEERQRALAAAAPALPALAATVEVSDSQVSEARPEAPVDPPPMATPYSESLSSDAPIPGSNPEETLPRIQPPSTGEQIPAARPGSVTTHLAAEPGAEAVDAGAINPEAIVDANAGVAPATTESAIDGLPTRAEQASPATEQAAHHG